MNAPKYLIVHHTGGTDANPLQDSSNFTFDQCNTLHKAKFNFISSLGFYVGYHYYIEKNGKVFQGRADTDEGAHATNWNSKSLGICLAGNFDATLPTDAQIASLKDLLTKKRNDYGIPIQNILPHRKCPPAQKTCFGKKLPDDWAQKLVSEPASGGDKIAKVKKLLAEAVELLNQI